MKSFIERVFKSKQRKQKELLDEIANTQVKEQATEAVVEAIIKEVKKDSKKKEVQEVKEIFVKPGHYFADCNCFKCIRWRNQNA
jgi:methionine salvage enolase-phosphatase E1